MMRHRTLKILASVIKILAIVYFCMSGVNAVLNIKTGTFLAPGLAGLVAALAGAVFCWTVAEMLLLLIDISEKLSGLTDQRDKVALIEEPAPPASVSPAPTSSVGPAPPVSAPSAPVVKICRNCRDYQEHTDRGTFCRRWNVATEPDNTCSEFHAAQLMTS